MAGTRSFVSLALASALLCGLAAPASAEVLSLERILLPDDMADRVAGSGVEARSCFADGGARQKVDIGILRVNLSERLAVKAGLGMAKLQALAFSPEEGGTAMAGGLSVAFWKRSGLTLSVEASALRAAYDSGAVMDGSMLVALSGR
jgi:hypothetical protein